MTVGNFIVLILIVFGLTASKASMHQPSRFCRVFGSIAVVDDPRQAHLKVYVEESEGLADVIVYEEEIQLYADRVGIWHFIENPGLADYVIYFEDNKYYADFSIYYTDIESFARCNH